MQVTVRLTPAQRAHRRQRRLRFAVGAVLITLVLLIAVMPLYW